MAEETETTEVEQTTDPQAESTEQTTTAETEKETTTEEPTGEEKSVSSEPSIPYHRFKEVYGRAKELERQLAAKEESKTPQTPQEPTEPNWEEYEAQGKTAEQFNIDLIAHEVSKGLESHAKKQDLKKAQQSYQDRQDKAMLNFQQSQMAAKAKHNDYDGVMQGAANLGIQLSPEVNLVLSEKKNAGELAYHIAKNHDIAYELMSLPVDQALTRLGEISGSLQTGNSQPAKMTNSEPPVNPLSGGGKVINSYQKGMSDTEFDNAFPYE